MDPAKTEDVENWPTPTNVKDVRAFLGASLILLPVYSSFLDGGCAHGQPDMSGS